jgi:hypothetical protein
MLASSRWEYLGSRLDERDRCELNLVWHHLDGREVSPRDNPSINAYRAPGRMARFQQGLARDEKAQDHRDALEWERPLTGRYGAAHANYSFSALSSLLTG